LTSIFASIITDPASMVSLALKVSRPADRRPQPDGIWHIKVAILTLQAQVLCGAVSWFPAMLV
jgi:hypothetical protein